MKIIVVGGTGTIGRAVVKELEKRHEVISVGSRSGDLKCDISSLDSIKELYANVGSFDALACAAGEAHFAEFSKMAEEDFYIGIRSKLMGQVNLVVEGVKCINNGGSFTLTSGSLNVDPIKTGTSAAMVDAAIEGFVTGVAIELPRGIRINVVSPTVILESMEKYASYFRGYEPVPAEQVALAFSKSVEGLQTGQRYTVGY